MQKYIRVAMKVMHSRDVQVFGWCAGVVAIWRICLELVNQAVLPQIGSPQAFLTAHTFATGFLRWIKYDSAWYLTIIKQGYVVQHGLHGQETIAFFPLFPVTVRIMSASLHTPYIGTGVVLNLILLCFTAYFLYKMTVLLAEKAGRKDGVLLAKVAVILLLLNPAAFFFVSLYADALLVFSMTASIYFALKESYLIAALFAGIATGTKSTGIVLLPILILMYVLANWSDSRNRKLIAKKHIPKIFTVGILACSGLIAYMAYLWSRFGDPLLFIQIEKYWDRSPNLVTAAHSVWAQFIAPFIVHDRYMNVLLYSIYLDTIPIALAIFCIYLLIRHRLQYAWLVLLCSLVVIMPLSTGQLASLNRYILVLTPALAYVAVYVYSNKYLKPILLTSMWFFAALLVILSSSFLTGYFMG